MSKFLTDLKIELRPDSDNVYVLQQPLVYYSDLVGLVKIPRGFQTDFASVPRVPLVYMAWGDRAHREAVIHDYLYRIDAVPTVPFMVANAVFLEAMECRGKPFYVRYPMYWGVVIGGLPSYHKHRVREGLANTHR